MKNHNDPVICIHRPRTCLRLYEVNFAHESLERCESQVLRLDEPALSDAINFCDSLVDFLLEHEIIPKLAKIVR